MSKRSKKAAWGTKTETAPVQHESLESANAALSEVSKVVSMKEEKMKKEAKTKKERTTALPQLPSLPKARGSRIRPDKPCECGCGGFTKARFMPGHDSWLRGVVLRLTRGIMKMADVEAMGLPEAQVAVIAKTAREAKKQAKTGTEAGAE